MTLSPIHDTVRVVTWNLERKAPTSPLGSRAVDYLFGQQPDIAVVSEARTSMPTNDGHMIWSEPPGGTRFAPDERKMLLWSRSPWTDIDREGAPGLDRTRFIAATTQTPIGPLRVLGICIPWHMADVRPASDPAAKPWQRHLAYLEILADMLAGLDQRTVIAGDFNQRVPRRKGGHRAAAEALQRVFAPVTIATAGTPLGTSRQGIDHIAHTPALQADRVWGWPHVIDGHRLSDHDGAGVDLCLS